MKKKKQEPVFDFGAFQNYTSDAIKEWFKGVPDDWKAAAADFIACEAVIFGARDTYQGIGILEVVKRDYLELCKQVEMKEGMEFQSGLN